MSPDDSVHQEDRRLYPPLLPDVHSGKETHAPAQKLGTKTNAFLARKKFSKSRLSRL